MQVILTRLQNSKTENLTGRFVRFYHFISAHDEKGYSADFFIQVTDKVQPEYVNSEKVVFGSLHHTDSIKPVHSDLSEHNSP